MERYLLNTTTNVICVAGDVAVTDYKKYTFVEVMAEEVEVEGGFAIIGTKENGEIVEAFLSEEAYFEGKEFRVGRKVPRTLIVEGKELEVEARKMEVEEAIKTINAYLEEVGAVINKIEEDELRHELRDIENPLKWYVANLEEMVAKKEEAEEIEMVAGTKVKVVAEVGYKGLEGVVVGEAYTSRTDGKKALIVEVEKVGRKYLEVEEVEAVNEKQEVVTKKVVKSKIKAVKDIVAVNRIPYTNKEGKELTYLYAIGEEAIEETLEELEKIAGLVATLERYDYIEGRLGQITVRHDGSRGRSNTILEIYILKEDKEEEPTVEEEEEEEVEIVAEEEEAFVGKAVKRVILDGIKIAKQVIEGMESGEIEFDHETYNYYKYERIPRLELDLENI